MPSKSRPGARQASKVTDVVIKSAERVYWQARYLERAENMARLLHVFSALQLDLPKGLSWDGSLLLNYRSRHVFLCKHKQENERNVVKFYSLKKMASLWSTCSFQPAKTRGQPARLCRLRLLN